MSVFLFDEKASIIIRKSRALDSKNLEMILFYLVMYTWEQ